MAQTLGGVEVGVLQHVGRGDASAQARVESQLDHPLEPRPVEVEKACQRVGLAGAQPLDQYFGFA